MTKEDNAKPAPPPRANPLLLGHERAENQVLAALRSGRMAHAWLISGPAGIGKATFAFRVARYLLVEGRGNIARTGASAGLTVEPTHPVFRRVASGGHADLLTIERQMDDRRQRLRNDILVDDVRAVGPFLASTPAEGGWRVVIVDGADGLTVSAANAVLKVVEEPPDRSVLLLTCVRPARLLPTLRSRCRRLALSPLPAATVRTLLGCYRPTLKVAEGEAIVRHAAGSIGTALALADSGGLAVIAETTALLAGLPDIDGAALLALAERAASAPDELSFDLCVESVLAWLADVVRLAAGAPPRAQPAANVELVAKRASLDRWLEVWDKTARLLSQADHANLDRRQVLLAAFFGMRTAMEG